MKYNIVLQPGAENDIDDAYLWYEGQQKGLGDQFLSELVGYYEKLRQNPLIFKWIARGFRQASLYRFPYVLVFKVIGADVQIYAVFHTSRNPKYKLRKR
jgi:plasmid stabilization system protein ParE